MNQNRKLNIFEMIQPQPNLSGLKFYRKEVFIYLIEIKLIFTLSTDKIEIDEFEARDRAHMESEINSYRINNYDNVKRNKEEELSLELQ